MSLPMDFPFYDAFLFEETPALTGKYLNFISKAMRRNRLKAVGIGPGSIAVVWGVASGATASGPALEGPRASGLSSSLCVCQAIFSGKLEMPIYARFKILLQGQIP
jgi:hypothetical protein